MHALLLDEDLLVLAEAVHHGELGHRGISHLVEDGERLLDDKVPATSCVGGLGQHGVTQKGQVVHLVGMFFENLLAQDAHVLDRVHLGDPRIMFAEPGVQALLGPRDDRVYFPERVVEIEQLQYLLVLLLVLQDSSLAAF